MRSSSRRMAPRGPVVVLLVAALLAAACGDDAGDDRSAAAGDDASSSAEPTADGLDWESCYGTAQCTTLDLPLDHDDPDGETIAVGVTRVPASGERIGPLFVNPGGPGGEAGEFAVSAAGWLPPDVTERFDIVGVDPRGLGAGAIDCGYDHADLYGVDHTIDSDEERDTLIDVSREYVDGCSTAVGDSLRHLGTRDVARDMDAVRAALGDEQLNYLGYSYGTLIGQVYADLFPENIRAMVLDGLVEPGKSGLQSAEDQAVGFERALAAFVADCDADPGCPLAPDALGAVQAMIADVEADPIPAQPRPLGPGELAIGMALPLYAEPLWPALAQGVADALDGDGSGMVALADEYLGLAGFDVYFAVNCLDFAWPDDPDEVLAAADSATEVAPHFGEALVNDYIRCSMWPVDGDPLSEITAPGTPPILVVSTTNDPATPHESAINVAERLESGVLLTYEGDGHGVVGDGVACIDDAVVDYLVDLAPPEEGTVC